MAFDIHNNPQIQARIAGVFPDELFLQVVEHLASDNQSLCTLARTCRRLQAVAEEQIYKTVELLSTSNLRAIIDAFIRRPGRVNAVQTLKILYRFNVDELGASSEERRIFNECVARMTKLKDWHIESPYDNFNWAHGGHEWVEQDMEDFRKALEKAALCKAPNLPEDVGLVRLEKLIIHSHGAYSDFWDLDGFHCLFGHPSLRFLHVSCFTLPHDLPELEPYVKSTPLLSLIFDECELETKSLRRILETPKALKHLTLGENCFNTRQSKGVAPRLSTNPEAAVEALVPLADSLESLTHFDPMWKTYWDPERHRRMRLHGEGMRNFHFLKFLDCDPSSFLHQGIILNRELAPPNLETLRLRRYRAFGIPDFFDELPDLDPYGMYLSSLQTLELVQPGVKEFGITTEDYICEPERLRERHIQAYKLYKRGVNMKMYLELCAKLSLIPPYLHGEPAPMLLCVYDSVQVGFYRHIEDLSTRSGISDDNPPTAKNDGEPRETDQLSDADILRVKNEVRRTLAQAMPHMDDDSDDFDFEEPEFPIDLADFDDHDWDSYDDYEEDDFDVHMEIDEFEGHALLEDGLDLFMSVPAFPLDESDENITTMTTVE